MLEQVGDEPLLRRQAQVAMLTGMPVWIALPPDRPLRNAVLEGLPVSKVIVQDAAYGLSSSVKAGNAAVPADFSLLLFLADLPEITTENLLRLSSAAKDAPNVIVRATTALGKPGHPVVFPALVRAELEALSGDNGARDVLVAHSATTVFVPLPGESALTDLDTPEDWAEWRAKNQH